MRGMELLTRMDLVSDTYIEAADRPVQKRRPRAMRYGLIAACLCVLAVAGSLLPKLKTRTAAYQMTPSSVTELQQLGYRISLPEEAENITCQLLTNRTETIAQADYLVAGDAYSFRTAKAGGSRTSADLSDLPDGSTSDVAAVSQGTATLSYTDSGAGKIFWFDEANGDAFTVFMAEGASSEKLLRAADPLEYHGQVHDVAAEMDPEQIIGRWKYDQYDAYIDILDNGTFYYLGSDMVRDTAYEYTLMDDCLVLLNEFGGEDTVLYFTQDGKLVDAGGDGLTKVQSDFSV